MLNDFKNAFQRKNNAHVQLIIINIVVFLALGLLFVIAKISQTQPIFQVVYDQFTLPSSLSEFIRRPWTLLTYSFAHLYNFNNNIVGISHIFFNMLGFYWFAKLFVEYLGSDKLVAVYILGALSGGFFYFVIFNTVPYFANDYTLLVGSSAAVFAVMTATATLLPDYTFHLMFIGPIKIKFIAAVYIIISFLFSVGDNAGGNIAHLGGALIGFVYTKQLQSGINWGSWITATLDWFKSLFNERSKVKVTYRKTEPVTASKSNPSPSSKVGKTSQDEIDAILDKISDRGYDSLTRDEKEKLFNASKK